MSHSHLDHAERSHPRLLSDEHARAVARCIGVHQPSHEGRRLIVVAPEKRVAQHIAATYQWVDEPYLIQPARTQRVFHPPVYETVAERVADDLLARIGKQLDAIRIGDPAKRENWLGPVVNARAYQNYAHHVGELRSARANLLHGGRVLIEGDFGRGYYVEPVLAEAPGEHPLWRHEMFLPILMAQRYRDRDEAMRLANDTDMGLTAGFYGSAAEVPWFHENIEAGVTYANRAQSATTGAWPGYQPFGGWKGSGSSGKGIASAYYLPLYLREQSRTVVD